MVQLADEKGRGITSNIAVTEDEETPGSARIGTGLIGLGGRERAGRRRLGAASATKETPGRIGGMVDCEDESGALGGFCRKARQLGQGHPPQNLLVRMGLAGRGGGLADGRVAQNGP